MIIGSRRRYVGPYDRVLTGKLVVILAVHREGRRLQRDDDVLGLRDDDLVEVSPLLGERVSCLSHEVEVAHVARA